LPEPANVPPVDDQITAVFDVPLTEAEKLCEPPAATLAAVGVNDTPTVGVVTCVLPPLTTPEQPDNIPIGNSNATAASARINLEDLCEVVALSFALTRNFNIKRSPPNSTQSHGKACEGLLYAGQTSK